MSLSGGGITTLTTLTLNPVGGSNGFIPEMESVISQLERGTVVTKYFIRKRPEKLTLSILRETRQIVWKRSTTDEGERSGGVEGGVDLRQVKSIRAGKNSKDFEKWEEESKRNDVSKCFVVFYGSEFRLRSLSIAALSEKECDVWIKGLNFLVQDTLSAPYPSQLEMWVRKEFYSLGGVRGSQDATLKDLKLFLPKINCKMGTGKLRDLFQQVDSKKTGLIKFDDFSVLFNRILYDETIFTTFLGIYSIDGERVTLKEFQRFLSVEQKQILNTEQVSEMLRDFLRDPDRDTYEPYMTSMEFTSFLFSKSNEIFDPACNVVTQDMTRPLSHYWIASSHNTYLTGDQFSSESSVEAYARCLLQSCRCVELDCWDGPDGIPFIYHGHTLTTKIKFVDVLKCIKEFAFVKSQYPVILSIEDHCSLAQQRKIASKFLEIFGDMLVSQPLDKNETQLPSPEMLKRKIILKHKKLPEGVDEGSFVSASARNEDSKELDLSNTIKNGVMYLEDSDTWSPHFFVLTQNKLVYTEVNSQGAVGEEEEEGDGDSSSDKTVAPQEELHFSEKWFHGRLKGGRNAANALIEKYNFGDGTFLVRESETFVGDYTLSFWRRGRTNHCHIHSKYEWGLVKYYLVDSVTFDSLYSLITYYRSNPIRGLEFHVTLTEPVPQPQSHEDKEWYMGSIDRATAEDKLKRIPQEGAFIVRQVSHGDSRFGISFRAASRIKHCIIKEEGRLYTVGINKFETLVDLINFYEKHPFYNGVCLTIPATEEAIRRFGVVPSDEDVYGHPDYLDTNVFRHTPLTVRALYDYTARRDDELSFPANSLITNVLQEHPDWWVGDYGNKKQHWFPVNYVEVVEASSLADPEDQGDLQDLPQDMTDPTPLGALQKGSIEISASFVELVPSSNPAFPAILKIYADPQSPAFILALRSAEEAKEWAEAIKETALTASEKENKNKRMERINRVAKELSSLIIYCCSVNKFSMERVRTKGRIFYEMSSFPETTAEKLMTDQNFFIWYHQVQFSRVYPKGQRLDSSNYNPMPMWNAGCQMVALNYQTGDKAMQLNQGRFRMNGGCGYVLRPDFMLREENSLGETEEGIVLSIKIIAARHLSKSGRGIVSPFVEVEVLGSDLSGNSVSYKTKTIQDNGFNPVWNELFEFDVNIPQLALIRFSVQDEDMFGDPNFIGQATYPVPCLREGYRSVPLQSGYSEDLELASLLVHLSIKSAREEASEVLRLRDALPSLSSQILKMEEQGDKLKADELRNQFRTTQDKIISIVEMQRRRRRSKKSASLSSIPSIPTSPPPQGKENQPTTRTNSVHSFQWRSSSRN